MDILIHSLKMAGLFEVQNVLLLYMLAYLQHVIHECGHLFWFKRFGGRKAKVIFGAPWFGVSFRLGEVLFYFSPLLLSGAVIPGRSLSEEKNQVFIAGGFWANVISVFWAAAALSIWTNAELEVGSKLLLLLVVSTLLVLIFLLGGELCARIFMPLLGITLVFFWFGVIIFCYAKPDEMLQFLVDMVAIMGDLVAEPDFITRFLKLFIFVALMSRVALHDISDFKQLFTKESE